MPASLMEYFNKNPRIGVLSTSSKDGRADSAVFGSPHMIDEKTVVMATARNRTLSNLIENPYAVYLIMEPVNQLESERAAKMGDMKMETGSSVMDWKGVRVYMRMKNYATSGEMLDMIRSQTAKFVGEEAAKMIQASVTFEIYEVRPLIDFGQGWENSL
ncbi:MAG TPA: pyridoxamine 5'-phosphate oxidase family protein [Methanotrichaceae archaeon]|nr:pyridoxamine 5'-phosphate oxidase family protein [Methanotrichaceae archaeon]